MWQPVQPLGVLIASELMVSTAISWYIPSSQLFFFSSSKIHKKYRFFLKYIVNVIDQYDFVALFE
jgi:hypothetical protein